eukprot:GHVU01047372.1.p2 GENE.GHVU01047372.1~~GHVU01047372.1.p2  ORF type:complete len:120 (+),score=3.48 GHVU01047372.1:851-1210(+)
MQHTVARPSIVIRSCSEATSFPVLGASCPSLRIHPILLYIIFIIFIHPSIIRRGSKVSAGRGMRWPRRIVGDDASVEGAASNWRACKAASSFRDALSSFRPREPAETQNVDKTNRNANN